MYMTTWLCSTHVLSQVTFAILLVCVILVSSYQYIDSSGSAIQCMTVCTLNASIFHIWLQAVVVALISF